MSLSLDEQRQWAEITRELRGDVTLASLSGQFPPGGSEPVEPALAPARPPLWHRVRWWLTLAAPALGAAALVAAIVLGATGHDVAARLLAVAGLVELACSLAVLAVALRRARKNRPPPGGPSGR